MTASADTDFAARMAAHNAGVAAECRAKIEAQFGKGVVVKFEGNTGEWQTWRGRAEACAGSEDVGFVLHEYDPATDTYGERGHWLPWARVRQANALLLPGLVAVGDGVTMHLWSDRNAGTVTWVSPSGKTFEWSRDVARKTGGPNDEYSYEYESVMVPKGEGSVARWSKTRTRFATGGSTVTAGRHEYYDRSF